MCDTHRERRYRSIARTRKKKNKHENCKRWTIHIKVKIKWARFACAPPHRKRVWNFRGDEKDCFRCVRGSSVSEVLFEIALFFRSPAHVFVYLVVAWYFSVCVCVALSQHLLLDLFIYKSPDSFFICVPAWLQTHTHIYTWARGCVCAHNVCCLLVIYFILIIQKCPQGFLVMVLRT